MTSVCIRTSSGLVKPTYHGKTDSITYHKKTLTKLDLNREVSDAGSEKQQQKKKKGAASSTKKRVRFQKKKDNAVAFIPRWRDLPQDQAAEIWWSPDAMDELKRDWKYAVYRVEKGETLQDGAGRGLDQHTEEGAWEYYSAQRKAMNAVLEEQDRLSSLEEIAEAYISETAKYVQKAIERARQDTKEAKEVRLRRAEALHLLKEARKVNTQHNKKKKNKSRERRGKSSSKSSKKETAPKSSITGEKGICSPKRHL